MVSFGPAVLCARDIVRVTENPDLSRPHQGLSSRRRNAAYAKCAAAAPSSSVPFA